MNEVSQHVNMGGLDVFCEIWNIRPQKSSLREAKSDFVLDLTGWGKAPTLRLGHIQASMAATLAFWVVFNYALRASLWMTN